MHSVAIQLGSNQGDPAQQLSIARQLISERVGQIEQASRVYRTEAWGMTDQPDFLNQLLLVRTEQPPAALMQLLLRVETEMGRERIHKWGPRLIDLDIIFYDQLTVDEGNLRIPHPQLQERNFVLIPLLEIMPDYQHPILKKSVEELYLESRDKQEVFLEEE